EREEDALADLIGSSERVLEKDLLQRPHRVVVAQAHSPSHASGARLWGHHLELARAARSDRIARARELARRQAELLAQARGESNLLDMLHQRRRRAEGRLLEEANGVGIGRALA